MTGSKKQPKCEKAKKPAVEAGTELSEKALSQASGGAMMAYMPADQMGTHSSGGGGGAGVVADGSVKNNSSLIGLL